MMHVYGQEWVHAPVFIVGDKESLLALADLLVKVATGPPDKARAFIKQEVNDGEDFHLHVHREDDMEGFYLPHQEHHGPLDKRKAPYTCKCKRL